VGAKLTRIRASKAQNNPLGDVVPPRIGKPLTIFPVDTLLAFESAETQLLKSPAEQFCINPLLPYTNKYGWIITHPPDTAILLSKVNVVAPLPVAAFEITKVVLAMETTVVFAGMYVPDTD